MIDNRQRNKEQIEGIVGEATTGASSIFSAAGRLARMAWNAQMQLLVAIGAMGLFRKNWWLFLVIGALLSALSVPVGVIWAGIALFALQNEPQAEDDFIVEVEKVPSGIVPRDEFLASKDVDKILRSIAAAGEAGINVDELHTIIGTERARVRRLTNGLLYDGVIEFSRHQEKRYIATSKGQATLDSTSLS